MGAGAVCLSIRRCIVDDLSSVRRECQVLREKAARIRAESARVRGGTDPEVVECLEAPAPSRCISWGWVVLSAILTVAAGTTLWALTTLWSQVTTAIPLDLVAW